MTQEEIRKHRSTYHCQKLSKRRIEFDGRKCQGVGCQRTQNLDAHHISYENCGKEEEFYDLITLCRSCHQREHYRLRKLNDKQLTLFEIVEKQPLTVLHAEFIQREILPNQFLKIQISDSKILTSPVNDSVVSNMQLKP